MQRDKGRNKETITETGSTAGKLGGTKGHHRCQGRIIRVPQRHKEQKTNRKRDTGTQTEENDLLEERDKKPSSKVVINSLPSHLFSAIHITWKRH